MSNTFWASVLILGVLTHGSILAQSPSDGKADELDQVVVAGRLPGPPLWKVSTGGHALWILPVVDMYPKKMEWESARVEKLIGESQEFISPPGVASGIATANPFLLVRVLRLYNTMEHLPGKRTLVDVLPSDLYQRFRDVKTRHFPSNDAIERLSVRAAARAMQKEILDQENLTTSPLVITEKTNQWLKRNKAIHRTSTDVGTFHALTSKELTALSEAMKVVTVTPEFARSEVTCFEAILTYFENDLEPVKRRANAWASGHIENLVNPTPLYSLRSACLDPFSVHADMPAMKKLVKNHPGLSAPDLVEMTTKSRQQWLEAAEKALSLNSTTFALLGVNDVFDADGLVAQLHAKGYKVEVSAN